MPHRSPRDVPEIRDAITLFEQWEAAITDPAAAGRFVEAVQLLNDYLDSEPESPHRVFVQNLKMSNTRRLLQLLSRVDKNDVFSCMEYVNVVFLALKDEAEALMASNADLKQDFEAFASVWRSEYLEALQDAKKRQQ
jgi:hypothetical protein